MKPFKAVNKLKTMNSRTSILGIIAILGVGVFLSVTYAASTIITDTSISTTNLTVTGTCSGCGGDGSFTTYALVTNKTVTNNQLDSSNLYLKMANDGSSFFIERQFDYVILNSTSDII